MKTVLKGVFVGFLALALNAGATTPVITSQPRSLTINIASTATFSVGATGTDTNALTYQWMFGTNTVTGATNATLTLDDVATNQAGAYSVIVTSTGGGATNSQPAQLTLLPGTIVQLAFSGYATGGSSNLVLQLFDHDKPATVQNFLHYITAGGYSNMFWSRCVPGFVLQGGDYVTDDRSNGPPPQIYSVAYSYTENSTFVPPFPPHMDNEYSNGPTIPNTFGTVAMAKTPGNPDSATSAFFFNLGDNTTNLDDQNGGFTVFGRILPSSSNILSYFNTFSLITIFDRTNEGVPTNGIFDSGAAPFTAVPINFHGLNTPGDSNLFYVDFSFPTPPVIDTNPPTVAIGFPTNNVFGTNADVVATGTAADNVGLACVTCRLYSSAYNSGFTNTLEAVGTTNWSCDFGTLPPGDYALNVVAQDGAGNLSTNASTAFVVQQVPFNVYTNGPGTLSTNLNLIVPVAGTSYTVKAIPARGALFADWTTGSTVSINPTNTFIMQNGLQLTAEFVSNTLPGGVAFTYPAPNAKLATTNITLKGKVAASAGMTSISARIFSKTNFESVAGPLVASTSTTWSLPEVSLGPGQYMVEALATNAAGKTTVVSESFTVLSPINIDVVGSGKTSITNGEFLQPGTTYIVRATPDPGSLFYAWTTPSGVTIDTTVSFLDTNGLELHAMFVTNALAKQVLITNPRANSLVHTNNVLVTGTVSASVSNPQINCQLFNNGVPATLVKTAAVNGTNWSVTFDHLVQGLYTAVVFASDSAERQTVVSERFIVDLFPNVVGTYYGVFSPADPSGMTTNNSGFFRLAVNNNGVMSGILEFPTKTYTVLQPLNYLGGADIPGSGIYFDAHFNLTNGDDAVTGFVFTDEYVPYTGYRAVTQLPTNTLPGKYILQLNTATNLSATGPTNDGYATLSIAKTGGLTLAGTLSDNSIFSEGVGVSRDGVWPVYAMLYGRHGMLIGWETNVIGANGAAGSTGTLYWLKAPTRDTYFTNGFTITSDSVGTNYVAPVAGTQYTVEFSGGTLNPPLMNTLTVSAAGQFVPAAGAADKLKITLSTAGAITGTIFNPATGKTLSIRGAFTSPALGGAGFVLDTDGQSEPFQITLVP